MSANMFHSFAECDMGLCTMHSTYAARGEWGQAIVINFITVQGEGGKKAKDLCMYYVHGPLARGCLVFFASICSLQDSTK